MKFTKTVDEIYSDLSRRLDKLGDDYFHYMLSDNYELAMGCKIRQMEIVRIMKEYFTVIK